MFWNAKRATSPTSSVRPRIAPPGRLPRAGALLMALAVLLGLAAFGGRQAPFARADAGFTSVPGPDIHPLLSGGHVVQVMAVTEFDASVGIVLVWISHGDGVG
ncbi:MAG: hypothetical protein ACR2PL_08405 [Dehalococcoidia bacterium]